MYNILNDIRVLDLCRYISGKPNILKENILTAKHKMIPINTGMTMEISTYRHWPVSFLIVQRVVAQGA